MKKKKNTRKREIKVEGPCPFCQSTKEPNYKSYKDLYPFVSDRARIQGKGRTGVCSKHQRSLSKEIKRARHLGLLPFAPIL